MLLKKKGNHLTVDVGKIKKKQSESYLRSEQVKDQSIMVMA